MAVTSDCRRTTSQAYLNLASSLTSVGIFAGALTLGTLLTLPDTIENLDAVSTLLSVAFVLFTISVSAVLGIWIVLRRDVPDQTPSLRKTRMVVAHIIVVSSLLVAGFIVLFVVLLEIGQQVIGAVGITTLGILAAWMCVLWYLEVNGKLEDELRETTEIDNRLSVRGKTK